MKKSIFVSVLAFFFFPQAIFAQSITVSKVFSVSAKTVWFDTQYDVPLGSVLTLNASGTAWYSINDSVFPTGKSNCTAGITFLVPGLPCYALIGRIGNGQPFFVGSYLAFTTTDGGRLFLSMNDEVGLFADNQSAWTVYLANEIPPPPPPRPPLIFIPGIGGSELKTTNEVDWSKDDGHGGTFTYTYPAGETVWVNNGQAALPGDDDYFDILRMKSDGNTSEANLELTGNLFAGAYQPAIDFFTANGYTLNQDLFVFPYDWRKDLSLTTSLLDQQIETIKQQTSSQKVDIVAHSMGGLVARNYIADNTRAQKVRKLIELGAPHLGAVKSLKALQYGDCLTDTKLQNLPFCIGLPPSEMKDVLQNMIGGYELAPTQTYYNFYTSIDSRHPFPFKDDRDIDANGVTGALTYSQTKTLLSNLGHNTALFSPSETFHAIDSNLSNTNGVDVTVIAGSGRATLGQIVEKYAVDLLGVQIPKKDEVMINGDDTVPLFSASLSDSGQNHSLLGSAKLYYTHQKHGDLVASGSALLLAKNILDSNTQLPAGVSQQPYSFNGVGVSVHSPVNIHAYDASGNHTGPTPDGFEENIPGSSYETLDDAKFIYLPENGIYTIKFDATDQGSFDFKIRDFTNDQNNKTILYQNIPLTANTTGQTSLDTSNVTPPQVALDSNGDGITDSNVSPTVVLTGNAAADQTPPISSYSLNSNPQNGWFKTDIVVTLSANDEASGSGVAKTEYAIDNGNFQPYTTAFSINKEGTTSLKIKSTDAAGNQEFPQSLDIKIDKTPPEPKASFNLQNQAIEVIGTDNLSTVTVSENPAGQINLTDLAGNSTKLTVSPTTVPRKTKIIFLSIQYGTNTPISLPSNELDTTLRTSQKTNQVSSFSQKLTVPNQTLSASFDSKTNTTTITIGQKKQSQTTVIQAGMIFLQLSTKNGQLEAKY